MKHLMSAGEVKRLPNWNIDTTPNSFAVKGSVTTQPSGHMPRPLDTFASGPY